SPAIRRSLQSTVVVYKVRNRADDLLVYDLVRKRSRLLHGAVTAANGPRSVYQVSALSPDGRLLAAYARADPSPGGTHEIIVWDVETGQKVGSLSQGNYPV